MSELIIPPERCVLEVLEHVDLDADLLQRIAALRRRGYRIALDDFTLDGKLAAAVPWRTISNWMYSPSRRPNWKGTPDCTGPGSGSSPKRSIAKP